MNRPSDISALDLLRRLEPAVRPGATGLTGSAMFAGDAPALFESKTFDDLLTQAFNGEIQSDRPVQVGCDLKPAPSAGQLERLAHAADKAETEGARLALMMIDGRGLVLDVAGRTIVGEMRPDEPQPMLHVDAAMVVPASESAGASRHQPLAGLQSTNAGVAQLIATLAAETDAIARGIGRVGDRIAGAIEPVAHTADALTRIVRQTQ